MKRTISSLTLSEAMQLIPAERFVRWTIDVPSQEPSATLLELFRRFSAFDLETSEAAKVLLIDALLIEVVPAFPRLKVWKATPLESDELSGIADYVISPDYAYVKAPLLCAVEAKRDDFVQGAAQCIAEMVACRSNNQMAGLDVDIYGIVSNGNSWLFYRLTLAGVIFESVQYGLKDLPPLLGVLNTICAACACNVPE